MRLEELLNALVKTRSFRYICERIMKRIITILLLLGAFVLNSSAFQQSPKRNLPATRISEKIEIDGRLDEQIWKSAPLATNFVTYSPTMGEDPYQKSEVMVVYDDRALYVAARLYDTHPDSILAEFSVRDNIFSANTDRFKISLNPYNDGQNIYEFEISASNVQADSKISVSSSSMMSMYGRGDRSWNAVWLSAVQVTHEGWDLEIEIPYSAIRFPNTEVQTWGINFWRTIRRNRETSTWNPVDRSFPEEDQDGELVNISSVKAPLRLELYPFAAGYYEIAPEGKGASYAAGMDLKYGINEAYTLDMTLIPDFGQRKSDDVVLNLTPYEVKYRENRQFFTEGLELFDKSGLFYSRRIGKRPDGFYDAYAYYQDSLESFQNPEEARLINATKISGRSQNNLGLGFFNAMTANTYAKYQYPELEEEKFMTEPFTNYNMLVADQVIGRNSYVNLANTNVYRPFDGMQANVSDVNFRLADKDNAYNVSGNLAYSSNRESNESKAVGGYSLNVGAGKTSGSFTASYNLAIISDTYDPNRMGYLRTNNVINHDLFLTHRILEPFSVFNSMSNSLMFGYDQLFLPREYSRFGLSGSSRVLFRDYSDLRLSVKSNPLGTHDWFEPRVAGRFFVRPADLEFDLGGSSDYRRKLAFNAGIAYGFNKNQEQRITVEFGPRIRFNDKLSVTSKFEYQASQNEIGYAGYISDDSIGFGRRQVHRVTSQLSSGYVFNNKAALNLSVRHYWSAVDYQEYYLLREDGGLNAYPDYPENEDINFNILSVDLEYSWNLSPGSYLTVVWKNNVYVSEEVTNDLFMNYWDNLNYTIGSPQTNSFSAKLTYYLDYHSVIRPRLPFP